MSAVYRSLFGKPDGTFIALRCFVLGHDWERCDDLCCNGHQWWCKRCIRAWLLKPYDSAGQQDRQPK